MDNWIDVKQRIILMLIKFDAVYHSVAGWSMAILGSIYAFLRPEFYAFGLVLLAIMLDAIFGLTVAIKQKSFVKSKLLRVTMFKISAYFATLLLVYMVERLAHDGAFIGVRVAAGWAAACEFWSMSASILILRPDMPFFKIMRRQLRGEIAAKLGEPVADILK